jgi:shikimate kinase
VPSSPLPPGRRAARPPRPPQAPGHGPLVVLCGPMGSGKTTVGRALGRRWAVGLRDTDQDVERVAGTTVAEIFRDRGEDEFRRLEHEAVVTALAEHRGVLALGGGAVLHAGTQAALAEYVGVGGVVVFLDVGVEQVASRIGLDGSRPLLAGDARERWLEIMLARRSVYERVATVRTPTDGRSAREVAREIGRRLRVTPARPADAPGA